MGLNCGCPAAAHLADLLVAQCKEGMGQIQKVAIQRIFKAGGEKNSVSDPSKKASFATLFSAADGSKMVITPYLYGPETEPGAKREFGSGNEVLGGIPIIIGREATTFTANMYEESQVTIKQMKQYMCENIGVWLIDEYGNIGCIVDNPEDPKTYMPIPIGSLFIGDKKLGGYENPDSNAIEWSFYPNWSDDLYIVKKDTMDFNPLTDWVNVSSSLG